MVLRSPMIALPCILAFAATPASASCSSARVQRGLRGERGTVLGGHAEGNSTQPPPEHWPPSVPLLLNLRNRRVLQDQALASLRKDETYKQELEWTSSSLQRFRVSMFPAAIQWAAEQLARATDFSSAVAWHEKKTFLERQLGMMRQAQVFLDYNLAATDRKITQGRQRLRQVEADVNNLQARVSRLEHGLGMAGREHRAPERPSPDVDCELVEPRQRAGQMEADVHTLLAKDK